MKKTTPSSTKTSKVLAYLRTGHSLDIPKATALWGHIRLSDIIFRLRKKGFKVRTEIIESATSDVKFAVYRLPNHPLITAPKGSIVKVLPLGIPEDKKYEGLLGKVVGADVRDSTLLVRLPRYGDVWFDLNELEGA